jgi:hypothetical protein
MAPSGTVSVERGSNSTAAAPIVVASGAKMRFAGTLRVSFGAVRPRAGEEILIARTADNSGAIEGDFDAFEGHSTVLEECEELSLQKSERSTLREFFVTVDIVQSERNECAGGGADERGRGGSTSTSVIVAFALLLVALCALIAIAPVAVFCYVRWRSAVHRRRVAAAARGVIAYAETRDDEGAPSSDNVRYMCHECGILTIGRYCTCYSVFIRF